MLLSLTNAAKSFGEHTVLQHINVKLERGSRVGLIGRNGAGKSTLLRLISGQYEPDEGVRSAESDLSIGYLEQNAPVPLSGTVYEQMQTVFRDTYDALDALDAQQKHLSVLREGSAEYTECARKIETLTRKIASQDGYQIDVKIATVLTGLGFSEARWNLSCDVLSGGERVRAGLARLLLGAPDLLLLDEPTNHLDFKTLSFLEEYLLNYRGAVIIVSHDRYFLDRTVNEIWEVRQPTLTAYPGNYTKYKELFAQAQERAEKEYEAYLVQKNKLEDYIARNLVRASTSAMAKSRQKELEKLVEPPKPIRSTPHMRFSFSVDKKSVQDVLKVEDLSLSIGEKHLFDHLSFSLSRGKKIAIVGENGIGKTTLFRALMSQVEPQNGQIRWGANVSIGYYDQHQKLPAAATAFDILREQFLAETDGEIRSMLAGVQLIGELAFANPETLSGGQKAGLCFAALMHKRDNMLLLDEPTNHLDLMSREALEKALCDYDGTLLLISHDRYLLQSVPEEIWELTRGGVRRFLSLEAMLAAREEVQVAPKKETVTKNTKLERQKKAKWRQEVSKIEAQIHSLETRKQQVDGALAAPDATLSEDYKAMQELYEESASLASQIDEMTEQWLSLQAEGEQ